MLENHILFLMNAFHIPYEDAMKIPHSRRVRFIENKIEADEKERASLNNMRNKLPRR